MLVLTVLTILTILLNNGCCCIWFLTRRCAHCSLALQKVGGPSVHRLPTVTQSLQQSLADDGGLSMWPGTRRLGNSTSFTGPDGGNYLTPLLPTENQQGDCRKSRAWTSSHASSSALCSSLLETTCMHGCEGVSQSERLSSVPAALFSAVCLPAEIQPRARLPQPSSRKKIC